MAVDVVERSSGTVTPATRAMVLWCPDWPVVAAAAEQELPAEAPVAVATFNDFEAGLLSSKERPIVIVKRKAGMLEDAAPGLGNIGLFLPYTGVQYLMF